MNLSLKKSKLFFVILLLLLAFTIVGCKKGGDDKGGDQDNLFTNFSKNNNIPLYLFSKATKMVPAFAKLFE